MTPGTTIGDAVRRRLVDDPAEASALADVIRALPESRAIFPWFRRLAAATTKADGDVLRKALESSRFVDGLSLSRFANSGSLGGQLAVPFVAAAMMVHGRLDVDKIEASRYSYAAMRDNFERSVSALSSRTVPTSVRDTYMLLGLQHRISARLLDAGYIVLASRMGRTMGRFVRFIRGALSEGGTRGFTEQWTFAIGHMVILACLIRGQEAGILDFKGVKIWKGQIANWYLWERVRALSRNVEVVPQWSVFAEDHFSLIPEWVDGRFVDYFEACGIVADRCGDARGAILERPSRLEPALARFFEISGFDPSDRIVTLHAREPGFRREARHDLRNLNVADCLPAMAALVARGYRVVRLGDPTMTPLPPTEGVFDYAVSGIKSTELDVLLPATAAFHIGSSSGLSLVPLLFATPCLFLNWYPLDLLPWGRRNWTLLRPIEAIIDRSRVVDRSTYSVLGRIRERRLLQALGHDAADLAPEEITRAVLSFAASLDAEPDEPAKVGDNIGRVLVMDDSRMLHELR